MVLRYPILRRDFRGVEKVMIKQIFRSAILALSLSALLSVSAFADNDNFVTANVPAGVEAPNSPMYSEAELNAMKAAQSQQAVDAVNGVNSPINMAAINASASSPFEAMVTGQKLASVNGMSVTYQMATGETVVLDGLTIASWVTGNDGSSIYVDQNQVAAYVQGLKDTYDTKGVQTWLSADGTQKSLATSYGYYIDLAGETAALTANIQALQSVVRQPVYSSVAARGQMPQWGDTFVEVSIASQHAYYYQGGNCVWESPIVSGTQTNPDRATPKGVFSVYSKETNRVLKGPISSSTGKPTYESHVDYWMPFNGGIGLHDASWRSSFGGNIYLSNGSHGCINLPRDRAQSLYGLIGKGTVVVVCD
ncbi:Putative peptidoglycan binding domain-containing protein [Oribacterium sp. KHPX15]|nr:Putative peptidoglycan binding domain-containing protein [Oribacterium sp. KHPX15]